MEMLLAPISTGRFIEHHPVATPAERSPSSERFLSNRGSERFSLRCTYLNRGKRSPLLFLERIVTRLGLDLLCVRNNSASVAFIPQAQVTVNRGKKGKIKQEPRSYPAHPSLVLSFLGNQI